MAPAQARRGRISLRLRLTLWVVAIFLLIQVTLGVVFLLYQQASIDRLLTQRLEERAASLASGLARSGGALDDRLLRELAADQLDPAAFQRFSLAVYGPDARLLAASDGRAITGFPRLDAALAARRRAIVSLPAHALPGPHPDAHEVRLALHPFLAPDGTPLLLLAATTDTYAQRLFETAAGMLAAMIPVGALAAGLAGWCIAGIAIAPIRHLHDVAHHLSPQSMDERVDLETRLPEYAALERELDEARKRIHAAFQAQQRFISNVSHELKTPISVILAQAQTLGPHDPDRTREFVGSVQEEMRRLGAMVDSFLLLTRVREGRAETVARDTPVNDLIMQSVEDCNAWAAQHRVAIAPTLLDRPDTVDTALRGDPHLLRTMLDNLVFNAIRFSPPGERIDIRADAGNAHVTIAVRDHGPGIDESMIAHVFDRFAQSDAEHRQNRSSGLGLEIAQGIAELHEGSISVRNLDDAGCEFTIRLPAERGDAASTEGACPGQPPHAG